jgi:hypothetical protein
MASDPFYSPKRTLARARHHVRDFESKLATFATGKDWTYVGKSDPQGRTAKIHKIKFDRDFFEEISCIAFDAANNLRSVLDQTAYTVAVLSGAKKPFDARFPMARNAAGLKAAVNGRCVELPPEIRSLFSAFKPYPGGNYCLPALNTLCNTQKHAALIPFRDDELALTYSIGGMELFLGYRWDPENYELHIHSPVGVVIKPTKREDQGKFAFNIAFDHTGPGIKGNEPSALLNGMMGEVERVLMATEAECRRIGLLP